jgi:hypothetical protein
VHLAHEQDPVAWRARYAAGETLDRTPYGYDLAAGTVDLDAAEVEAITALGRADGRLFDGDPATHEES